MESKMRILIACEESQAVTIELRKLGHEAFSCDLLPCSGGHPEWHLQMDMFKAFDLKKWDFIGLHIVCTAMAGSGNRHYAKNKPKHQERLDAIEFSVSTWKLICSKAKYTYMENPIGAMNTDKRLPKPQIVQPWWFGDKAQKSTCLWTQNLPLLEKTDIVEKGEFFYFTSKKGVDKRMAMWYYKALQDAKTPEERKTLRSKTFQGIAKAIATQWTNS